MRMPFAASFAIFLTTSALAQPQNSQTVTVGPWAISTAYKADKFDSCTMSRSTGVLGITFARTQDGLLLVLDSSKWKLDRGKTYSVRLTQDRDPWRPRRWPRRRP
jgi:hypothetical protein